MALRKPKAAPTRKDPSCLCAEASLIEEPAARIASILDERGAGGAWMPKSPDDYGPVMSQLLAQYSKRTFLTQSDENGEHPLYPVERDTSLQLKAKKVNAQQQRDAPKNAPVENTEFEILSLVEGQDTIKEIKEDFFRLGNSLCMEDFVHVLRSHLSDPSDLELEAQIQHEVRERRLNLRELFDAEGAQHVPVESARSVLAGLQWASKPAAKDGLDRLLQKYASGDEFAAGRFCAAVDDAEAVRREKDLARVRQLVDMFELIDLDESNAVSWEELTGFLTEKGMTDDVLRDFSIIKFTKSEGAVDEQAHMSHVEKVCYLRQIDKLAYFEKDSKVLKLCAPDLTPFKDLRLGGHDGTPATIVSVSYIEKYRYLVISCSDLSLSFYEVENNFRLLKKFHTRTCQQVMCWSELGETLFSADTEGTINAWDPQKLREPQDMKDDKTERREVYQFFTNDTIRRNGGMKHDEVWVSKHPFHNELAKSARPHDAQRPDPRNRKKEEVKRARDGESIVLALLDMPKTGDIASAGVDKNIMFWDALTGKHKRTLEGGRERGGHEMGVRALAFSPATTNLVSGGFDYQLIVWNPYVGKPVHYIKSGATGHNSAIIGIDVLGPPETSTQIVTAEAAGVLKTWSLATYVCLQTITVDDLQQVRAFVPLPPHNRILAAGRKFVAYDYDHMGTPGQTDEAPILKASYDPRLKVFLTATPAYIRIWDGATGSVKCVIHHDTEEQGGQITSFCTDDRGRKVFVCDEQGGIWVYNAATGGLLKNLEPHEDQVSAIVYGSGDKTIISVSWDKTIKVHDESDDRKKVWRTARNVHGADITCIAVSRKLDLIATGSCDQVISLRDYERLRLQHSLLGHRSEITSLCFLDPYPMLASADLGGSVAIWAVSPHPWGYCLLTRCVNMHSLESTAACHDLAVRALGDLRPPPPVLRKDLERTVREQTGPVSDKPPKSLSDDPSVQQDMEHYRQQYPDRQLHLYSGDEEGMVRQWDLTLLLQVGQMQPCPSVRDVDPHRKDEKDDRAMTELTLKKAEHEPELQAWIRDPLIRSARAWKAHRDSVQSVSVLQDPEVLLTGGYDFMVCIWNLDTGDLINVLAQSPLAPWQVKIVPGQGSMDEGMVTSVYERILQKDAEREQSKHAHRAAEHSAFASAWPTGAPLRSSSYLERCGERLRDFR